MQKLGERFVQDPRLGGRSIVEGSKLIRQETYPGGEHFWERTWWHLTPPSHFLETWCSSNADKNGKELLLHWEFDGVRTVVLANWHTTTQSPNCHQFPRPCQLPCWCQVIKHARASNVTKFGRAVKCLNIFLSSLTDSNKTDLQASFTWPSCSWRYFVQNNLLLHWWQRTSLDRIVVAVVHMRVVRHARTVVARWWLRTWRSTFFSGVILPRLLDSPLFLLAALRSRTAGKNPPFWLVLVPLKNAPNSIRLKPPHLPAASFHTIFAAQTGPRGSEPNTCTHA